MAGVWKDNPNLANEVVRLWNAGRSAREIATILGHGLTGNAVIGCANRLRKNGVHVVNKPTGPASDKTMAPKPKTVPRPPAAPKRPAIETAAIKLKIRELRTEKNLPAAAIAEQVGLTKAQVGGYLSAMGLGAFKIVSDPRSRCTEIREGRLPKLAVADVTPLGIGIEDLTRNTCRWPEGDAAYTFCGHATEPGRQYCGPHRQLGTVAAHGAKNGLSGQSRQKQQFGGR